VEEKRNQVIVYREINESDIPAIFEVRISTDENNLSLKELESFGITENSVFEKLRTTHKGWLCEVAGKVVGFTMGNKVTCEMWVIAVMPEYIKKGIGTELLRLVEEWLWGCDCKKIWLTTDINKKLRAYSFYINNGWEDDYIDDDLRFMRKIKLQLKH
jgi:ribosomal protein S18 acetylase RimI-like enzyme